MPITLLPRLHLVASGSLGFSLTDPYDCNCYLWEYEAGEFALFDCGAGNHIEPMLAQLKETVGDFSRINYICLTHHHADHMGGAAELRRRSGAKTVASSHSGSMIASGNEDEIGLTLARAKGGYPPAYHIEACPIDIIVSEGDSLTFGGSLVQVISTPGHCKGAVSYLFQIEHRKALVSGDVVFPGGKISLLNLADCSIVEYGETVAKLAGLQIDVLLPGHAHAILNDASNHIAIAHGYFDRLLVPPCL